MPKRRPTVGAMRGIFIFLLGVLVGGYAMHVRDRPENPRTEGVRDDVARHLRQWHLTGDDIRADLGRGGEVVRDKARVAEARISDARVAALIKAKYVLDRDLSARDIGVEVKGGRVVLTGTVGSPDLVGRAVALALDTDGAEKVTAHLAVEAKK